MEADQLMEKAKITFQAEFNGDPECVSAAPGRANLIGGHTDYNDGYVLPVVIDRHTVVAGRRRSDQIVVVHSQTFSETIRVDLSAEESHQDTPWIEYIIGVIGALNIETNYRGMELVITGNLPLGAGLSSSASLELAVGAVVRDLFNLQIDDQRLVKECWRAETEFVGVECGIMDQYSVAFGEANHALFLDCRDKTHESISLPDDACTVIIDTNVKHELAGSAYNTRVSECQEGVSKFDQLLSHEVTSLRDVSVEEFERHAGSIRQPVRDRCEHVVKENNRVQQTAEALKNDNLEQCGSLMLASHESLRDLYEVSCPELDLVIQCAQETKGVLGARMTGGGFGGSVIALVPSKEVESFIETVYEVYSTETDIKPDIYNF